MNFNKKHVLQGLTLILLLVFAFTLFGCDNGGTTDTETTYTVVYDGNGGYLGNKTYTIRKLQVAVNSKLPKYLQEYTQDPYVVSSLGLAIRTGYILNGWYQQADAVYQLDTLGTYVYLDIADGNGVYLVNDAGDYIYGYVEDVEGTLVFIYKEEMAEDAVEEDTIYIYYEGDSGYGFYIYDENNADDVLIYEADGGYTPSEVADFGVSYLIFDELDSEFQTLFADVPHFKQQFLPYTDADEGLTRYSFDSGYVDVDTMFDENAEGNYVYIDGDYVVYDELNTLHDGLQRYSINDRYVFTPTTEITSPSQMDKYSSEIQYWDFENDRVTSDMTLYAHWTKKLTVEYVQMSGQVTYITTKMNEDNTAQVNLVAGEVIGSIETIPLYSGYTFVGWSTSETEYQPWDYENDVFPEGQTVLTLYAYMIEGDYTRITSKTKLAEVANNPAGNYLLVKDLDLGGQIYYNSTPLGFHVQSLVDPTTNSTIVPFTGTFVSMGYSISNYTIVVQNSQKTFMATDGYKTYIGLFPYVQNATIKGLIIENATTEYYTAVNATSVVCELGAAGLIGIALDGSTTVEDVSIEMVFTNSTGNSIDYPVTVGDIYVSGGEYIVITGSTSNIDYSGLTGITTSTFTVQTLS